MNRINKKHIWLIVIGLVIVGSIIWLESRKADTGGVTENTDIITADESQRVSMKSRIYPRAKEISSPDAFINTDEITIEELIGDKVVLVDFWTYSCINCQRTLPHLNDWHDKYADLGLVILGIHTPEFEFEKDIENVKRAVEKYNIAYPVVVDNDFSTWRSYNNRYWPRKYLIGVDGFIQYDHIGEGAYEETEQKIVELLNEKNQVKGIDKKITINGETVVEEGSSGATGARTPEIYFGSNRVERLANLPEQACLSTTCKYQATEDVALNSYVLDGRWQSTPEYIEKQSQDGNIVLHFSANQVNIVAGAEEPTELTIFLDGQTISDADAGTDVKGGKVTVQAEDLYNLVDLEGDYDKHMIEIQIGEGNLRAFTFTFG